MHLTVLRNAQRSALLLRCRLISASSSTLSPHLVQKPSAFTVPACYLRTRSDHHEHKEKSEGGNGNGKPESEESKQDGEKEKKTIDPALAKKLRIYVLIVGGLSFVTSFFLLSKMAKEGTGLPAGANSEHFTKPGIEFNVFVQKYLKAGEVRNIVFCPQAFKAVAYLHEGAVIDGQRARENYVVISYTGNAQQFWADVRKEESLMGISLTNGVPITMFQGMTGWKVVELLIGVAIIAFLGTQYIRLWRQRILANKKTGGFTPPKKE